jgi:hypothetical protein
MKERWVDCDMECPACGGETEVLSSLSDKEIDDGLYCDSDKVECKDGCNSSLQITCDDNEVYISGEW